MKLLMKKLVLLFSILFLSACTTTNASFEVESFLNKFRNHEQEVMQSLDEMLEKEDMTIEQKNAYRLIMKRQYSDLKYKLMDAYYNGDEVDYKVEITVYDFINSINKAQEIVKNNGEDDSLDLKLNEELKQMQKETKRINYTINFKLNYIDNHWVLKTPEVDDLKKIHGIYEYEYDA